MKCPHCAESFFERWQVQNCADGVGNPSGDVIRQVTCPACERVTVDIMDRFSSTPTDYKRIYPQGLNRGPVSRYVPDFISADYLEACAIAILSPKASAALSRRCLQAILDDQGYKASTLYGQVKLFIQESNPDKIAPLSIRKFVDGIRVFGNFGAHPIESIVISSIVPIEEHEVEWSLAIIERLFVFFYIDPSKDKELKDNLNIKLKEAGKPSLQD